MTKEELIKKLENIKIPEIEIPSHKAKLKKVLIDWKYRQKVGWFPIRFKKILMPIGAATIVILVFITGINLVFPQDALAEAKRIAMKDPQIKNWVDQGATIKDIEVIDNKAYVLITPTVAQTTTDKKDEFTGALAEIELKDKKVSKIEGITPQIIPLSQREREKITEIVRESESPASVPGQATTTEEKIIKVESAEPVPTYNLKLIKENNNVKVLPEKTTNEKVKIIYKIDGERKEGEVNLEKEEIGETKILEETSTQGKNSEE